MAKTLTVEGRKVSATCEVIEAWNYDKGPDAQTYCGKPTTHWYPTQGGTMALCVEHAQKHLPHGAFPVVAESVAP